MTRALITGATSGLGLEFAWQLAGSGHELVLQGKNEDRLAAVAAQVEAVSGVHVETLVADLSDPIQTNRVARRLLDPVEPVSLLVNHSGHSARSAFLDADVEEHVTQIDTTIRATMVLSHAAARAMIKKGGGAIINVSSLGGLTSTSLSSATKCWVTVFTEALAAELQHTNVSATVLLPGLVHTDAHENAALNIEGEPRVNWMKAPYVVEQALKDCAAGEVVSVPSLEFTTPAMVKATPKAVRRALLSDRMTQVAARLRTQRTRRAAKQHVFRFPWQKSDS